MVYSCSLSLNPKPNMRAASWRKFLEANWDLGFTAFGGPPVHFKIVSFRGIVDFMPSSEVKKLTLAVP